MKEINNSMKLFRQAFIEAMNENTMNILAEYPEKPVYSKKHLRAMKHIISGREKPPIKTSGRAFPRKRLIAILIAAAILLGGLTVYANRDAVVKLVEKIYDTFTRITYNKDQDNESDLPNGIEEERIPTYVPDGFILQDYKSSLTTVYAVWQNENESITFCQYIINAAYDFDNERSDFITMMIGDYTVQAILNESLNTYIWNDGEYAYSIDCTVTMELEEVAHMIQSVSIKE